MKPELVILSDMWGWQSADWKHLYQSQLEHSFELNFVDSLEIAQIVNYKDEETLHTKFLDGGIERAVQFLHHSIKNDIHILGFSMGGYISWKAGLTGITMKSITAVSSTRIRLETEKPNSKIQLFFGEADIYKPREDWFLHQNLHPTIIANSGHGFYTDKAAAGLICDYLQGLLSA